MELQSAATATSSVNTFSKGEFFRIDMHEGRPGKVMRLGTSRPLKLPDALRPLSGETFLMAEGGGTLDRVSVDGDKVAIETLKDGLAEPTAVAKVGQTAWVASTNGEGVRGTSHGAVAGVAGFNDGPPKAAGQGVWGESQHWEGVHGISHGAAAAWRGSTMLHMGLLESGLWARARTGRACMA